MRYLLNAAYLVLLTVYLPILAFQRLAKGKKRPGLWGKFWGRGPIRQDTRPCALFHAVSLGEVNAIGTIVKEFCQRKPGWQIIVSTTTQTGFDAAKRQFPDLEVCLLPFDFSWSVRRFLRNLNPDLLILAELEIWPNLLAECSRQSIPTCLINARLNSKSLIQYKRFSFLLGPVFQNLSTVCCQNEIYAERFVELGVDSDKVIVTGNLKYDALFVDRNHKRILDFKQDAQIAGDDFIFIAGSTQAPEEQIAVDAYLKLADRFPNLRLLICPRHPERFDEVASILEGYGIAFSRRSEIEEHSKSNSPKRCERVLLLDCMGELKYWWGTGDIAFVGGSFGNRGGQNMIEPLALQNAVCFGPHTRNFAQEVSALKQYGAAVQFQEPSELSEFVERCMQEEGFRSGLKANAQSYLLAHSRADSQAWELSLNQIDRLIPESTVRPADKAA